MDDLHEMIQSEIFKGGFDYMICDEGEWNQSTEIGFSIVEIDNMTKSHRTAAARRAINDFNNHFVVKDRKYGKEYNYSITKLAKKIDVDPEIIASAIRELYEKKIEELDVDVDIKMK
ncbi:hypothetical protein SCACP_08020 [Sporomusa carbonis]|uniref:hypothetical protein n=1 Tax=Sporomusa carbonis TaxID=3076075 RepID=UPI003A63E95F